MQLDVQVNRTWLQPLEALLFAKKLSVHRPQQLLAVPGLGYIVSRLTIRIPYDETAAEPHTHVNPHPGKA